MARTINFKALAIFITFWALVSFSFKDVILDHEKQNSIVSDGSLRFLVQHSDLIAIVDIANGVEKTYKLSLSKWPPKFVNANVIKTISGSSPHKTISISSTPSYLEDISSHVIMLLKKGEHLVFLSEKNGQFEPTTEKSLLDIANGKVYPTWRDDHYTRVDSDGTQWSSGEELNKVIIEIESKIKS